MLTVNFATAAAILDHRDWLPVLETCWEHNNWEEEVELTTFLKTWTDWVERITINNAPNTFELIDSETGEVLKNVDWIER